jgi:hypothetical protein
MTVNCNRYCGMLQNFLRPRLEKFDNSEDFWFQQDGATAHTDRRSLGILREMFTSRLVSLRGDFGVHHKTGPDFCKYSNINDKSVPDKPLQKWEITKWYTLIFPDLALAKIYACCVIFDRHNYKIHLKSLELLGRGWEGTVSGNKN